MNRLLEEQAIPAFAKTLIHHLGSSLKWKIEDPHHVLTNTDQGPFLFAFWHNRILMIAYIFSQFFPHRDAKTLISPSRDGQWINALINQFGFSAIRGSTSKKPVVAYLELLREVKKGVCDMGITPDGPRGPIYKVQPGIIRLSQHTGRPIVPFTYHIKNKYELKSWDRFQIPLPLSEVTLVFQKPKVIPPDLNEAQLQSEIEWLQNALGK